MRNDWQSDDDRPQTRADYRREQQQATQDKNERDGKRIAAQRRYAREHPGEEPQAQPNQASQDELDPTTPQAKQQRLGRRLNWAIFWLAILIIAVYLILFFVEF